MGELSIRSQNRKQSSIVGSHQPSDLLADTLPMNTRDTNPVNVAKVEKIYELFDYLAECRLVGEYHLEWNVKDGVICDISTSKVTGNDLVQLRQSLASQREVIAKHHADSLCIGWHGTKGVSWIIHPGGTHNPFVTDKRVHK